MNIKKKKLKSVLKGDIKLDTKKDDKKFDRLIDFIKEKLKEEVKDVRLSGRLKDSACCLVADEGGLDPAMEKLMKAMGQNIPASKRILEINPAHPVFEAMNNLYAKDKNSSDLNEYVGLLYDQALLLEGSKPKDPTAFAKTVAKLMVENAKHLESTK